MSDFTALHVTADDWQTLCEQASAQITAQSGSGRLAFIYLADALAADADRIVDRLRESSGIPHWVGCVGMGVCSTARETYAETAAAVLLTPYQEDEFRVLPGFSGAGDEWLAATRSWREANLASVAVVHGDPASTQLPSLLVELSEALQGGFLVGGIASAEQLAVRLADRAVSEPLSGVLFSGRVAISTGLTQGCSLIGQRHRVTAAERNIIATVDDRPALDVLKEDIGEVLARDLRRIGGYIFAALPVSGSDTGDYLVRNLVGLDPDNGLLAIGDLVKPGQEIQFARRDAQTARDDLAHMIESLKARLPGPPRGGLYFSCLGRGRNQFGDDSAEMRLVAELLGDDVPLVGFYANGEISHYRLYGYTGVLTLFC